MDRYHINIFWSDEDDCYIADLPDLSFCSAFGETPGKALVRSVSSPNLGTRRQHVSLSRVTAAEIAARVNAGEPVDQVAEDLDLTSPQIEDAILFERDAVGSC